MDRPDVAELLTRLDAEETPDPALDADLLRFAQASHPDVTLAPMRFTAGSGEAIGLPFYLGIGWAQIIEQIPHDLPKWQETGARAQAGDELAFCRRFLMAVLRAAEAGAGRAQTL